MVARSEILAAIEANPTASNRQLGLQLQVDHKTVARVRAATTPKEDAPATALPPAASTSSEIPAAIPPATTDAPAARTDGGMQERIAGERRAQEEAAQEAQRLADEEAAAERQVEALRARRKEAQAKAREHQASEGELLRNQDLMTRPAVRILKPGLTCCGEVLRKDQVIPNPCKRLLELARSGELHLGQQVAEVVPGSQNWPKDKSTHGFPTVHGKIMPRR
ncbi:MAG: hypothetical protein ACYCW6_21400 [Candidatus Xenobia bacterium]